MTFIEKAREWVKQTGITNIGWIAGFAAASFAGWWFIAGGAFGIFLYTNWNVIRKLYNESLGEKDKTE